MKWLEGDRLRKIFVDLSFKNHTPVTFTWRQHIRTLKLTVFLSVCRCPVSGKRGRLSAVILNVRLLSGSGTVLRLLSQILSSTHKAQRHV